MKRLLAVLLVLTLLVPSVCYAEDHFETDISLCYDGDAYSVDYVFEVTGDGTITDVILSDEDCYFEWNHIDSEAKLYLSIASGNVIPRANTMATIVSDAEIELNPVKMVVNGKIKEGVYAYHEPMEMEGLPPTIDVPGYTSSKKCKRCDLMIVEAEEIPASGPNVQAVLDDDGILSVTGALSDHSVAEGITFVAVYDDNGKMIFIEDATELDQNDFSMQMENAEDADTVKIFRFTMPALAPLHKAAETDVVK